MKNLSAVIQTAKNVFFSLERKLPFKKLIILIGRWLSRSLQRELDTFSKDVLGAHFNVTEVTKGVFSQHSLWQAQTLIEIPAAHNDLACAPLISNAQISIRAAKFNLLRKQTA